MTFVIKSAVELIDAAEAEGRLKLVYWNNSSNYVCMMAALQPGAKSVDDCVAAGWPEWLVLLNIYLFYLNVGSDDEHSSRYEFARQVAAAIQTPLDYEKARDLFLIRRLYTGKHSIIKTLRLDGINSDFWRSTESENLAIVDLLHMKVAGHDIDMKSNTLFAKYYSYDDVSTVSAVASSNSAEFYMENAGTNIFAAEQRARQSANKAARTDLIFALKKSRKARK